MASCKGCGHNFRGIDYHHKSVTNENGYCGWCIDEGVQDDASKKASDEAAERRRQEAAMQRHEEDEKLYGEEFVCTQL